MGGSPETIQQKSEYVPSQGEKPSLNSAYQQMYSLFNNPQAMYQGQTFAGASPFSQQAIEGLGGLVDPFNAQAGEFGDAWKRGLGASDVANNPYVQGQLNTNAQQVNQNLQRNILPGIQQGAVQAGGMNNARQGIAEGVAAGDASTALANANATTMLNAYNSGLSHEQAMMGNASGLRDAYTGGVDALSRAGAGTEMYQQQGIDDDMARWYYGDEQAQNNLNSLINQLGSMKYGTTMGEQTNPNYENTLTSVAKIGTSLGSAKLGSKSPGV